MASLEERILALCKRITLGSRTCPSVRASDDLSMVKLKEMHRHLTHLIRDVRERFMFQGLADEMSRFLQEDGVSHDPKEFIYYPLIMEQQTLGSVRLHIG